MMAPPHGCDEWNVELHRKPSHHVAITHGATRNGGDIDDETDLALPHQVKSVGVLALCDAVYH